MHSLRVKEKLILKTPIAVWPKKYIMLGSDVYNNNSLPIYTCAIQSQYIVVFKNLYVTFRRGKNPTAVMNKSTSSLK